MPERFYAPVSLQQPIVELSGSEAHHLKNVLRLGVGQEVLLFDGNGAEARAEISAIAKRTVELRILELRTAAPDGRPPLVLATAVPKGDRFRWLVEKATELGVARLVPLCTQRSVVVPRDVKLEKLRRTVIAASKQCGRARLMQIDAPLSWEEFVTRESSQGSVLVAHPSGPRLQSDWITCDSPRPIVAAIGPEGGLTDAEVERAVSAGARLVGLGENILRVETAAIAMCAFLRLAAAEE